MLTQLWFSPGMCSIVGSLGHVIALFSFLRHIYTVLHRGCLSYILTNSVGWFLFLHTLSSKKIQFLIYVAAVSYYLLPCCSAGSSVVICNMVYLAESF